MSDLIKALDKTILLSAKRAAEREDVAGLTKLYTSASLPDTKTKIRKMLDKL